MIKKLEACDDMVVKFTDEELIELGMEKNTKFTIKCLDNGTIQLTPFAKMEIDLGDFSREVLERLIKDSCEKDISVNEVISDILKSFINYKEGGTSDKNIEDVGRIKDLSDLSDTDDMFTEEFSTGQVVVIQDKGSFYDGSFVIIKDYFENGKYGVMEIIEKHNFEVEEDKIRILSGIEREQIVNIFKTLEGEFAFIKRSIEEIK